MEKYKQRRELLPSISQVWILLRPVYERRQRKWHTVHKKGLMWPGLWCTVPDSALSLRPFKNWIHTIWKLWLHITLSFLTARKHFTSGEDRGAICNSWLCCYIYGLIWGLFCPMLYVIPHRQKSSEIHIHANPLSFGVIDQTQFFTYVRQALYYWATFLTFIVTKLYTYTQSTKQRNVDPKKMTKLFTNS